MTTVHDTPETVAIPTIPGPRRPESETVAPTVEVPERTAPVSQPPAAEYPWPEPWRHARGARPRSEFWDVATASWHSRGLYPDRSSGS